jgi:50S ribosomal subunit-associated GTPase HflX
MPKAKSQAQARLFGAVAGGRSTKAKGMTKAEAKRRLRGVKVKKLPKRVKKRKRTRGRRRRR